MIDKLRKRFNHSASLGKTLARTQLQHFSYAEPKEFDLQSVNESKSLSKKRENPSSTPKQLAPPTSNKPHPAVPSNLGDIGQGILSIQLSRARCTQLSSDLHSASMAKSLQLNKLYKELHHFGVCIQELRWLLTEGDALLRGYLAQAVLIAPRSQHTLDIGHISQEFRSLLLRFMQIDKDKIAAVEEVMRIGGMSLGVGVGTGMGSEGFRRPLPTFPEVDSILSIKDPQGPSFLETRHFSLPLKQNLNTSNMPHFDNIKINKTESTKPKITSNPIHATSNGGNHDQHLHPHHHQSNKKTHPHNNPTQNPPLMAHSLKLHEKGQEQRNDINRQREELRRDRAILERQKEQLYKKLHQQHDRNQTLTGTIEMLKEELSSLQRKMSTYKVASKKSIQKLKDILQKLTTTNPALSLSQHDLQVLKLAQAISGWQKMLQDDLQQAKYRELYGHPEAIQGEKTTKLQEIIELQYDINDLLAQRQQIQRELQQRETERGNEELYRMLVVQASTLEQFCGA